MDWYRRWEMSRDWYIRWEMNMDWYRRWEMSIDWYRRWEMSMDWYRRWETKVLAKNPFTVPLGPPQISHGLTWVRTRTYAV
jgi:hypothetical protein